MNEKIIYESHNILFEDQKTAIEHYITVEMANLIMSIIRGDGPIMSMKEYVYKIGLPRNGISKDKAVLGDVFPLEQEYLGYMFYKCYDLIWETIAENEIYFEVEALSEGMEQYPQYSIQ